MQTKKYKGTPYHLWNPFTAMDEFLPFLNFGPIVIERGEGVYVYNGKDKRYINGFSSLWNVAIGYGRKELIEAASNQMKKLAYASCFRQTHPRAIELAAKLVEITDAYYQHVYLGSNGSEAVETAIKMARQYYRQGSSASDRGRFKIISLRNSYHGVSYGAVSTSGLENDADKFGPLVPGFLQIDPPYCFRCPYNKERYPECGLVCAKELTKIIQREGKDTVAAFILEPVMGAYGIISPPEAYYQTVGKICQKNGVLFIADEVTTGFGRTGKLFISQDWNPRPDILCLGKAISSGYLPLSATLATEEIYSRFKGSGNRFAHGSTASGHPVCAAVGLANIDIFLKENIADNSRLQGDYLRSRLEELMAKRQLIGDVRGRGLMLGIELVKDNKKTPIDEKQTFNIVMDIATLGMLVYYTRNILGILPPLIIDHSVADKIVSILDQALDTGMKARVRSKARLVKEFAVSKK